MTGDWPSDPEKDHKVVTIREKKHGKRRLIQ